MTKLDFKRILRRSIIRCRSATLSQTANIKPKAMPARRDYCNTDSPHVNIDSVRAKTNFRGFLWAILALFRAFIKAKTAKHRGGIGPLRLPRRDRELFSGYQLINGVIWILRTSRVEMQNYWPFFTVGRILFKSSFVIWNGAIFMHFWPFCTIFDGPVSWNRSCLAQGFLWPAIPLLGMRISKIMLFWP